MENLDELKGNDEKRKKLAFYFKKIEDYFFNKEKSIIEYKHIPVSEILKNAPKYYSVLYLIEKINIFLTKDKDWLINFVEKNNIRFDDRAYKIWKSGKQYNNYKYTNTQAPSKWIHILQDYLIELLECLQILLVMEYYINEDDYKTFLKDNPKVFYKVKANFVKPSLPSENIEKFFEIIDFLLNINMSNDFPANHIVDATLCIRVYRYIDDSGIFELLKRKDFYINFHLLYIKKSNFLSGEDIPFKDKIIEIAEKFMQTYLDFRIVYKEYKSRLIQKQNAFIRRTK